MVKRTERNGWQRVRPAHAGFRAATAWAGLLAGPLLAAAEPSQDAAAATGGGQRLTSAGRVTVVAAGQTETSAAAHCGRYTLYPGFIGAAFLQPGTTNRSGQLLEATADNDGDGLRDDAEVTGAAFGGLAATDPNAADTDGDGMRDGDEAAGGYDPGDPGHRLAMTALDAAGGRRTLVWIGRAGWHTVLAGSRPDAVTQVVHTALYPAGTAPWYKQTNRVDLAPGAAAAGFYRVRSRMP